MIPFSDCLCSILDTECLKKHQISYVLRDYNSEGYQNKETKKEILVFSFLFLSTMFKEKYKSFILYILVYAKIFKYLARARVKKE